MSLAWWLVKSRNCNFSKLLVQLQPHASKVVPCVAGIHWLIFIKIQALGFLKFTNIRFKANISSQNNLIFRALRYLPSYNFIFIGSSVQLVVWDVCFRAFCVMCCKTSYISLVLLCFHFSCLFACFLLVPFFFWNAIENSSRDSTLVNDYSSVKLKTSYST